MRASASSRTGLYAMKNATAKTKRRAPSPAPAPSTASKSASAPSASVAPLMAADIVAAEVTRRVSARDACATRAFTRSIAPYECQSSGVANRFVLWLRATLRFRRAIFFCAALTARFARESTNANGTRTIAATSTKRVPDQIASAANGRSCSTARTRAEHRPQNLPELRAHRWSDHPLR